jgi:hypothetical protein
MWAVAPRNCHKSGLAGKALFSLRLTHEHTYRHRKGPDHAPQGFAKASRRRNGGKPGAEKLPDGRIGIRAEQPAGNIADIFNSLSRPGGPSLSIEEMNEIAAKGWAGEL